MTTCLELTAAAGLACPVKLEQSGPDNFRVTYGLQVRARLNYAQAAHELGECIFHSLACASVLDNRTRSEAYADRHTRPTEPTN